MNQPVMDRWTAVKRIHQSALDKDASERTAFVDESCGGDETLRREVHSLLAHAADAESFLERPAANIAPTPPSESHETTLVGRSVSHYQVLSLLGAGGMGEVYLARDSRLGRTVALKILPSELATDPERMQRFAIEAKAASALNHPNVATIYDVGESDGIHFIVMEHVEGETIAVRIGRPLTPSEVVDIAVQAADALDVAHAKGITHRDIKPANLMLTHRGHVKVLDFGVAKVNRKKEVGQNGDWTVEPVTAVGSVVGSGPYMSPEQIVGGDVDPRSDVFSLGVVIYEMATGQRPFSGSTRAELMDHILHAAPEPMMRLNPALPSELERVTLKCLEKRPDDRYQSARELLTDLWPLKRQLDANAAGTMPDAMRFELLRRAGSEPGPAALKPAVAGDASVTDAPGPSSASELVARGRAHLRSASFFELADAVSAFQAATVIDPTFAAAYAGLAHAKVDQATNRHVLVEAFGEAKAAALRAVALDHESADAQAALGLVMLVAEWDWIAAERSFQRALAINPNHAEAYLHYGTLMEALGDLERGFQLKLQGLECDSTSALAHVQIAGSFWNQRRYDDVIVWANKALDRNPHHLMARQLLAAAYWKMGDLERAAELLRVGANSTPGSDGTAQADTGIDALRVFHYAEAGDLDAAFEHLHRLIDARDPALIHLAVAPQWDSLRADPRFNECLARMKLRPVL